MWHASRRTFMKSCAAVAALGAWPGTSARADGESWAEAFGLQRVGRVEPRASRSIAASRLSVGFETLDRRMFDPVRAYAPLAELGVKWARVQTGWARTEAEPGRFDFAWLDDVVDNLLAGGIQPWFNLGYGNRLYSPAAPDASAVGWAPIENDQQREAWKRYVAALAEHFAGRVRHWEIWNEPNITNFWKVGKPDAALYVDLVRITAPLLRQSVPESVLIGGALAGMPKDYLQKCMEQGLGDLVDCISYHPYRPLPEKGYDDDVAAFRRIVGEAAPKVRLWQGENGCPSHPGGAGALANQPWTEALQAKWLTRRILSDLRLDVELTSYFHTVDLVNYNWGQGATGKTNYKGLLRGSDYTPKPSYRAYQCLCSLLDSDAARADWTAELTTDSAAAEPLRAEAVLQASFHRNGRPMLAYWYPADLFRNFALQRLEVRLPQSDGLGWREAELIDPLDGARYRLRGEAQGGALRLTGMPLADYPLIIAGDA